MKKIIVSLLAITSFTTTALADDNGGFWRGDVNGDKKVTLADLTHLVAILNNKEEKNTRTDVNNDGKTDLTDIQSLLDILKGKVETTWQEPPKVIEFEGVGDTPTEAEDEQF